MFGKVMHTLENMKTIAKADHNISEPKEEQLKQMKDIKETYQSFLIHKYWGWGGRERKEYRESKIGMVLTTTLLIKKNSDYHGGNIYVI